MVEFALIAVVSITILLVGIQYAVIGQAALALNQAAYQGARFAAVSTNSGQSDVQCYLLGSGTGCSSTAAASPSLTKGGGKYLSVAMSPTSGPRAFGTSVTVTLTFDVCGSGKLFLGSNCGPFFGLSFPQSLSATETAMGQ